MTTVLKKYKNDKVYICLEAIKENTLVVSQYRKCGELYGYPEKQISYHISEERKAVATFNRYVRLVKAEEA